MSNYVPHSSLQRQEPPASPPRSWLLPAKHDLFGVRISRTCYAEAAELIMQAARQRRPMLVDHLAKVMPVFLKSAYHLQAH